MSCLIIRRKNIIISAPAVLRQLWQEKSVLPGLNGASMMGITWLTPSAGSPTNYTTPGSYSFTIPTFNTLTVAVYGAGGSGGVSVTGVGLSGSAGGNSSFNGTVIANGGGAGTGVSSANGTGGAGGSASGGDTNTTGTTGQNGAGTTGGNGGAGAGPSGGPGGSGLYSGVAASAGSGSAYGGGGGGLGYSGSVMGGGGGGGGYSTRTYSVGGLTPGGTATVVVGSGGTAVNAGGGYFSGAGAAGAVLISWS